MTIVRPNSLVTRKLLARFSYLTQELFKHHMPRSSGRALRNAGRADLDGIRLFRAGQEPPLELRLHEIRRITLERKCVHAFQTFTLRCPWLFYSLTSVKAYAAKLWEKQQIQNSCILHLIVLEKYRTILRAHASWQHEDFHGWLFAKQSVLRQRYNETIKYTFIVPMSFHANTLVRETCKWHQYSTNFEIYEGPNQWWVRNK